MYNEVFRKVQEISGTSSATYSNQFDDYFQYKGLLALSRATGC